jgi:hypothetical protein
MSRLADRTENTDPAIALHNKVKELIKQGLKEEEIVNKLMQEGLDEQYCALIIANIENDIEDRQSFRKLLIGGLFMTAAGLVINLLSYKISVNFVSFFYYVFWGIPVIGIVMIIRAFILFRK